MHRESSSQDSVLSGQNKLEPHLIYADLLRSFEPCWLCSVVGELIVTGADCGLLYPKEGEFTSSFRFCFE